MCDAAVFSHNRLQQVKQAVYKGPYYRKPPYGFAVQMTKIM